MTKQLKNLTGRRHRDALFGRVVDLLQYCRRSTVNSTRSCRSGLCSRGSPRRTKAVVTTWCLQGRSPRRTKSAGVSCLPSSACSGALRGAHLADVRAMSKVGGPRAATTPRTGHHIQQSRLRQLRRHVRQYGSAQRLSEKPPFRVGAVVGWKALLAVKYLAAASSRRRGHVYHWKRRTGNVRVHSTLSLDTE